MQVLFDTDVILELAALDLLEPVCEMLGVDPVGICVPPNSIFKLRNDRKGRLADKYGEDGLAKAIVFLEQASSCDVDPELLADLNLFAARADVEGLDEGEAVLLAMADPDEACLLFSKDKRWPPALQREEAVCVRVNVMLKEQVMCFEQGMLCYIEVGAFEVLRTAVVRRGEGDTALRLAFTSRPADVAEPVVVEGLHSLAESHRKVSGDLLIPRSRYDSSTADGNGASVVVVPAGEAGADTVESSSGRDK